MGWGAPAARPTRPALRPRCPFRCCGTPAPPPSARQAAGGGGCGSVRGRRGASLELRRALRGAGGGGLEQRGAM
eukprot:7386470-Prymnesium_polylepis.3